MEVRDVNRREGEKVELQMTPMIDIVFQLLIFFIMTFKPEVPVEGDFSVRMPITAPSDEKPDQPQYPPIVVSLKANDSGTLANIVVGDVSFDTDFDKLHKSLWGRVDDKRGPGSQAATQEIELNCSYKLKYRYVIKAVTAISGHIDGETGEPVPLFDKIKFSPPKKAPTS
ncbi:MAG: biopolymer transporter ExbD [Planctomycetes bacterium]|nr:biopolymer transporter ExbD [Planctomycetota bacterium]